MASMWGGYLHPKNTLVKSHWPPLPAVPNVLQLQGVLPGFSYKFFFLGGLVVRVPHLVMLIAYS